MGKANAKGRSANDPFIRLHKGVTRSEAWRSLSCEAKALLLEVWQRHNGQNNGEIPYSWREAREALRIGQTKVKNAFNELQERGFLKVKLRGSFDWKHAGKDNRATEWQLTTEPFNGKPPSAEYRGWHPLQKQNTATASVPNGYRISIEGTTIQAEYASSGYCISSHSGQSQGVYGYRCGSTYNLPSGGEIYRRVFHRTERPSRRANHRIESVNRHDFISQKKTKGQSGRNKTAEGPANA